MGKFLSSILREAPNQLTTAATFLGKIKDAVPERSKHTLAFKDFNDSLNPEDTKGWTEMVEAWEEDATKPNPFQVAPKSKFFFTLGLQYLLTRFCSYFGEPSTPSVGRGGGSRGGRNFGPLCAQ